MPFCSNCGQAFIEGQRYCGKCGRLLPGAAEAPAPPDAPSVGRRVWVPRTVDARGRPYSPGRLAGHWEFATFGQRFSATLVDFVVVFGVGAALGRAEDAAFGQQLVAPVLGLLYYWAGNSYGKTVGKAVLGIEVVKHSWTRPGLGRGLLREFVSNISGLFLGIGYLNAIWDEESRTWHDHGADTWVIKRTPGYRPASTPPSAAEVSAPAPTPPASPPPPPFPTMDDPPTV